jgi:hypothetical protein
MCEKLAASLHHLTSAEERELFDFGTKRSSEPPPLVLILDRWGVPRPHHGYYWRASVPASLQDKGLMCSEQESDEMHCGFLPFCVALAYFNVWVFEPAGVCTLAGPALPKREMGWRQHMLQCLLWDATVMLPIYTEDATVTLPNTHLGAWRA